MLRKAILAICVLITPGCMQLPLFPPSHPPVDRPEAAVRERAAPTDDRIEAPGKKAEGVSHPSTRAAVGEIAHPSTAPAKKRRRPRIFTSNEYGSAGIRYGTVQGIPFQDGTRGELDGERYTSGAIQCDVDFPRGPRFSLNATWFESEFSLFYTTDCEVKLIDSRSRFYLVDFLFTPARYVHRIGEIYAEVGIRYAHFTMDYDWYVSTPMNQFHSEDTIEGLMPLSGGGFVYFLSRGHLAFHGRCSAGIGPDSYTAGIEGALVFWPGRIFTGSIGYRWEKLALRDGGNSPNTRRMSMLMQGPIFELGFRF